MTPNEWGMALESILDELPEQFAWATNGPLKGFNAYKTDGGWLVVIKTASVQRGALVCFYGGATLGDCINQLIYDLHHDPGMQWKADKWPK